MKTHEALCFFSARGDRGKAAQNLTKPSSYMQNFFCAISDSGAKSKQKRALLCPVPLCWAPKEEETRCFPLIDHYAPQKVWCTSWVLGHFLELGCPSPRVCMVNILGKSETFICCCCIFCLYLSLPTLASFILKNCRSSLHIYIFILADFCRGRWLNCC